MNPGTTMSMYLRAQTSMLVIFQWPTKARTLFVNTDPPMSFGADSRPTRDRAVLIWNNSSLNLSPSSIAVMGRWNKDGVLLRGARFAAGHCRRLFTKRNGVENAVVYEDWSTLSG